MGKERQAKYVRLIKEDIEEWRRIRPKLLNLKKEVNPKVMERMIYLFNDVSEFFDTLADDMYSGKETY